MKYETQILAPCNGASDDLSVGRPGEWGKVDTQQGSSMEMIPRIGEETESQ